MHRRHQLTLEMQTMLANQYSACPSTPQHADEEGEGEDDGAAAMEDDEGADGDDAASAGPPESMASAALV